jgi:hypothetical protein
MADSDCTANDIRLRHDAHDAIILFNKHTADFSLTHHLGGIQDGG